MEAAQCASTIHLLHQVKGEPEMLTAADPGSAMSSAAAARRRDVPNPAPLHPQENLACLTSGCPGLSTQAALLVEFTVADQFVECLSGAARLLRHPHKTGQGMGLSVNCCTRCRAPQHERCFPTGHILKLCAR